MAVPWPVTLQSLVNEQSFSEETGETVIRTNTDVGPIKSRRRFSRSVDKFSVSINLTTAQYSDLKYFYSTTVNAGVTRFEFNHPVTGVLSEWRFTAPPRYNSIGGGNFQAQMGWELMP